MPRQSMNNHGVRIGIKRQAADPFQGLVVQPSNLSQEEIGNAMRAGRQQMMERGELKRQSLFWTIYQANRCAAVFSAD